MKKILSLSLLALSMLFTGKASATPVSLELLLLVDVSGSISNSEYNLQKTGYVDAFRNSSIQSLIEAQTDGIAVAYAEWASGSQQSLLVNWYHITDAASANAFADLIEGTSRAFSGSTAPGSAITWGMNLFNNNFEGNRNVIDVSGDGAQNDGSNTSAASSAAAAAGFTVNGITIGGGSSLQNWYANNVVTSDGFLMSVDNFEDFGDAVASKIGREIVGGEVPEPTSIALIGGGMALLIAIRRRSSQN